MIRNKTQLHGQTIQTTDTVTVTVTKSGIQLEKATRRGKIETM